MVGYFETGVCVCLWPSRVTQETKQTNKQTHKEKRINLFIFVRVFRSLQVGYLFSIQSYPLRYVTRLARCATRDPRAATREVACDRRAADQLVNSHFGPGRSLGVLGLFLSGPRAPLFLAVTYFAPSLFFCPSSEFQFQSRPRIHFTNVEPLCRLVFGAKSNPRVKWDRQTKRNETKLEEQTSREMMMIKRRLWAGVSNEINWTL